MDTPLTLCDDVHPALDQETHLSNTLHSIDYAGGLVDDRTNDE